MMTVFHFIIAMIAIIIPLVVLGHNSVFCAARS